MTTALAGGLRRLALPPAFTPLLVQGQRPCAFAEACRLAASGQAEAGTLAWGGPADTVDLAVVLAPQEPLVSARRAFFAGMVALAAAIGAHAPPEMAIEITWPGTLLFDGARIGGGRLAWPGECAEDREPAWLVFGALVIASKARAGDPGLTPFSTSLEEQGFVHDDQESLVEGFARNLMKTFEIWSEDGFPAVARRYLSHLPRMDGDVPLSLAEDGDLVEGEDGDRRQPLVGDLLAPPWLDPATGTVRL